MVVVVPVAGSLGGLGPRRIVRVVVDRAVVVGLRRDRRVRPFGLTAMGGSALSGVHGVTGATSAPICRPSTIYAATAQDLAITATASIGLGARDTGRRRAAEADTAMAIFGARWGPFAAGAATELGVEETGPVLLRQPVVAAECRIDAAECGVRDAGAIGEGAATAVSARGRSLAVGIVLGDALAGLGGAEPGKPIALIRSFAIGVTGHDALPVELGTAAFRCAFSGRFTGIDTAAFCAPFTGRAGRVRGAAVTLTGGASAERENHHEGGGCKESL